MELTRKLQARDFFPPLLGLAGVSYMLLISYLLREDYLPTVGFTAFELLNLLFTMQVLVLPVSFLVLGLMYLYDRDRFRKFFRKGDLSAPARPLQFLGITEKSSWKQLGPTLALILTAGTALFMTIGLLQAKGVINATFFALLPLSLLFSTTNAWSEEIFTRFTVVAGLDDKLRPAQIYWISAAVFGIPHYFGTPGGFIGMLMASFMGWLLAKSVHETKGIFWAWFIHFVQDVVIFGGSLMLMLGKG